MRIKLRGRYYGGDGYIASENFLIDTTNNTACIGGQYVIWDSIEVFTGMFDRDSNEIYSGDKLISLRSQGTYLNKNEMYIVSFNELEGLWELVDSEDTQWYKGRLTANHSKNMRVVK